MWCLAIRLQQSRNRSLHHSLIYTFRVLSTVAPGYCCTVAEDELKRPEPPGPEDCCQVYQRQLLQYQRALAKAKGQPEPADPFEELERQLYGEANDKETKRTNTN